MFCQAVRGSDDIPVDIAYLVFSAAPWRPRRFDLTLSAELAGAPQIV